MFLFKDIIGNKKIISGLRSAIQIKKIFHSYIFYGENGLGKSLIANCFAKFIQCENKGEEACDICYSCESFNSQNNPDIIYVRPSKTKSIGVDDIREQVCSQAELKPYVCPHKIFIIDNADEMTVQAQNALLKILEEPPEYLIFILIGERLDNFLSTIISRCVKINIKPVEDDLIKKYLKDIGIKDDNLVDDLSQYSHGNIGKALALVNNKNFIDMRKEIFDLLEKIDKSNPAEALTLVSELEKFKDDFNLVLDIIYFWYYNLPVRDFNNIYNKLKAIDKAKKYLVYNTNFKMILNTMLLEISGG